MVLSDHARIRMRQRGVPRRALERDVGQRQFSRYAKALNACMVCAGGRIATVGHRYQRVIRY